MNATDGDPEKTRVGLVNLRCWFFNVMERIGDPTDVSDVLISLPETVLEDKMDEVPEGIEEEISDDALSIFDFYQNFKSSKAAAAARARTLLRLEPDRKTTPAINVGVRFLYHLSHALRTTTRSGDVRSENDPGVPIPFPLKSCYMSHIVFPECVQDPTEEHKAVWANPDTGVYDSEEVSAAVSRDQRIAMGIGMAFPGVAKLWIGCPSCEGSATIEEALVDFCESLEKYMQKMCLRKCGHCGVEFSGLHPSVEVGFSGISLRSSE